AGDKQPRGRTAGEGRGCRPAEGERRRRGAAGDQPAVRPGRGGTGPEGGPLVVHPGADVSELGYQSPKRKRGLGPQPSLTLRALIQCPPFRFLRGLRHVVPNPGRTTRLLPHLYLLRNLVARSGARLGGSRAQPVRRDISAGRCATRERNAPKAG